jgi:hypothetical protein
LYGQAVKWAYTEIPALLSHPRNDDTAQHVLLENAKCRSSTNGGQLSEMKEAHPQVNRLSFIVTQPPLTGMHPLSEII